MPYLINSRDATPTPAQYTQLEIDDAVTTADFKYFKSGRMLKVLSADISRLFLIRFVKFDLKKGSFFWGHVQYAPQGKPAVTYSEAEKKIVLTYDAAAEVIVPTPPPLPAHVETLKMAKPENIRVTVTINAAGHAGRPSNYGWLNFDIRHTFPKEFEPRSAKFGWEEEFNYPILRFDQQTASAFQPVIIGPLQYSAIYTKTDSDTAVNTATGIAIHVEDERGQFKLPAYHVVNREFSYVVRNAIHLHGSDYVRPAEYALTGGDDYGYGGQRMVFRLRAFQLDGACAGAPVGWHDVVGIYRDWLRARFRNDEASVFYDKIASVRARPRNAPADEMSPHTVIANYGLDGAVDPPNPPAPPGRPHLSKWLEMNPMRHGAPDIPNNENDSILTVLGRLKDKFPDPEALKLEVQVWGIEKAGFFQFLCGFPPLCNLFAGNPNRFRLSVNDMARAGIAMSVTTDPLNTIFNRLRYAGHLRWKGRDWKDISNPATWEPFITSPFPASFSGAACPVSVTKIKDKQFNRVWVVDHQPGIERVPEAPDAVVLNRCQKKDGYGQLQQNLPVIGDGLHRATQKQLCPTAEAADVYLNRRVKPWLIDQGVRIVEFMKYGGGGYFCYRTDHQHIVPHPHAAPRPGDPLMPPAAGAPYTNVIGWGSWLVRRLQCIFYDLHEAGKRFDADPFCSFRLSHEFVPVEALAPYVDQYYSTDEMFNFVYSHLVTPIQTLARPWGIHPGYKEERLRPGPNLVPPAYMLDPDRDADPMPPLYKAGMTPAEITAVQEARKPSFKAWRAACVDYFNENFGVAEYGIAPRAYPTELLNRNAPPAAWNPEDPLAPTNPRTYTYNRCVQDVFNLRANIFDNGLRAVLGERIMIPSPWLEEPLDYNDEAVNCLARAAQLQMRFKEFFRHGFMLGQTRLKTVNGRKPGDLWAWGSAGLAARSFDDVAPLLQHIAQDDPQLGADWRQKKVRDFISKGWDKQVFTDGSITDIVIYPQIQHRVWQHGEGDGRRLLYAFANVGNTDAQVGYIYGRGLEGVTRNAPWRLFINIISPEPPPPDSGPVWLGLPEEELVIPARSFVGIEIRK
jgi:hypothetical protein